MAEIDSPVDYYLRVFSNFEFGPGGIFAINHSVAFIGAITGIFVISLSFLVFRAGNEDNLKNRAIGLLLFTEGISAFLLAFFWIYPFSLESLRVITWFRALGGVLGFTRMFIMVFFPLFFIETNWAKKGRQIFQWKFVWILPTVSFMIIAFPILSVGLSGSFGDMAYVFCSDVTNSGFGDTVFGTELGYEPICPEKSSEAYPAMYVTTSVGPISLPIILATTVPLIFVTNFMRKLVKRNENKDDSEYNIDEIRALRTGFIVKVGFMVGGVVSLIILAGIFGFPTPEMTLFNSESTDELGILVLAFAAPLIILCHILATFFEGVIFTYAILNHEVMGIDERLRKGFTATTFAGFGAIMLLVGTEMMENAIPGSGILGGIIIGVPLIALRKPIIRVFSNLSTSLMPETHTQNELKYLEVYAIAMDDGIISSSERSMLNFQSEVFGIDVKRREYLEDWYNNDNTDQKILNKSEIQSLVSQEWTDESGFTWRKMNDETLMWWNGNDWIPYSNMNEIKDDL